MPSGFKTAVGSAGVVFIALAALAWVALPFGHPVYAVFVPPLIVAGIVFAIVRHRAPRHPSIRDQEGAPAPSTAPIEPK
jgi:nitrate/nitrite transporter NarK